MGKKKQTTVSEAKVKFTNFYGTKSEWVKGSLDGVKMSDIFVNGSSEQAVVAEDSMGLYVTGSTFVDAPVLDPYRIHNRTIPTVTVINEDGGEVKYSVSTL